ncbi:MAG: phosphatidylserine decarboxylase family protein [Candidatus Neomarinimicrobiota bacterium]
MASEGKRVIMVALVAALITFVTELYYPSFLVSTIFIIVIILLLFFLVFFREPKRNIPPGKNIIVAPADGKVVQVKKLDDPDTGDKSTQISIFMSVFDVHINWVPVEGKVLSVNYRKGSFLNALDHRASDENERTTIVLDSEFGKIKVRQIAGLLARRIICYANKGFHLKAGERLGFIMFGSRMDVILPRSIQPIVHKNQRVVGSKTEIGRVQ